MTNTAEGSPTETSVLIVTGGMLPLKERSFARSLAKQVQAFRRTRGGWLDVHFKLLILETILAGRAHLKSRAFRRAAYRQVVERYFDEPLCFDTPELAEVLLGTLLQKEEIPFRVATYEQLYSNQAKREALLNACQCIFASTTLLRDMGELRTMLAMLKRPHNKVVAGGALVTMLAPGWQGDPGLDLLAVGHGERLVPSLAAWIRSGFRLLRPPEGGEVCERGGTLMLSSGCLSERSLDHLVTPDWQLAAKVHGSPMRMAYYESVRGCPYRCAFCNYPYLFAEQGVRFKSAQRIATDFETLEGLGVEYVSCLDSLFTTPRRRLVELCELLVRRKSRIKWICYARADDLTDLGVCRLMKEAGCHQVQIGIESGSQRILNNMKKRTTVAHNKEALLNCRASGLTTVVTVILGFPGETPDTVRATYELLRDAPPDICYAAAFNARFENAPILQPENASRFGLITQKGLKGGNPYWRHDTMSCTEVGTWLRWLTGKLVREQICLDGSLFYAGALGFRAEDRKALLVYQRDALQGDTLMRKGLRLLDKWARTRLQRDVERVIGREVPSPFQENACERGSPPRERVRATGN